MNYINFDKNKTKNSRIFWMVKPDNSFYNEHSRLSIVPKPDRYNVEYFEVKGRNYKQQFKTALDAAKHIMQREGVSGNLEHVFAGDKRLTAMAKNYNDRYYLIRHLTIQFNYVLTAFKEDLFDPELNALDKYSNEEIANISASIRKRGLYNLLMTAATDYFESNK